VPTPEADRPEILPPAEPGARSESMRYGPSGRPTQSNYQRHGPGVWSGVKIGCGIFIVLPILIALAVLVLMLVLGGWEASWALTKELLTKNHGAPTFS